MTKRKKTVLIVLAIAAAIVIPCVGGVVLLGIGVFTLATVGTTELEVTDADRDLMVTAADVAPHTTGFVPSPIHETFTKTSLIDNSIKIQYEYDAGGLAHPYIVVTVSHEQTPADADMLFGIEWNVMKGALGLGPGTTLREDSAFYSAGDHSRFGTILESGSPTGNLFVAREGNSIYAFTIMGATIADADAWKTLFDDRVETLDE